MQSLRKRVASLLQARQIRVTERYGLIGHTEITERPTFQILERVDTGIWREAGPAREVSSWFTAALDAGVQGMGSEYPGAMQTRDYGRPDIIAHNKFTHAHAPQSFDSDGYHKGTRGHGKHGLRGPRPGIIAR